MSRLALYQKYRSQSFDEVVGQEHVVRAIQNAVRENKVGHAYLFCGPRGTGKTTMARLLARAVNCENKEEAPCGHCESCVEAINGDHPDIIEINAANETHVEDIRDLIERAQLSPMMGKYKIYIVDEVHQLSTSASSALLKTLEEPPAHVIFILATTDPQKLLNTIISRCQRFDFTKVDTLQIQRHLMSIAAKEDFQLEPQAAMKIAELADGGMRDSLSILEQASSYAMGDITEKVINDIFGLASIPEKMDLLKDIFTANLEGVIKRIRDAQNHGIDLKHLTDDLADMLKDAVIYQYTKNEQLLKILKELQAQELAGYAKASVLLEMVKILNEASMDYRHTNSIIDYFEVTCMQLISVIKQGTVVKTQSNESVLETQSPIVTRPEAPKPTTPVHNLVRPSAISQPVQRTQNYEPEIKEEPKQQEVVQPQVGVAPVEEVKVEEKPKPVVQPIMDEVVKQENVSRETIQSTQPKQEEVKVVDQELPMNQVLGLLAQCNKTEKAVDMDKMNQILNATIPDRYIATLRQCQIGASGENCIVLIARSAAIRNTINTLPFNKELYFYLEEKGIDKVPYAITTEFYKEACQNFIV